MTVAKFYRYADLSSCLIDYLKDTRVDLEEIILFNEKFIVEKNYGHYLAPLNYEMEKLLSQLSSRSLTLSKNEDNLSNVVLNNCLSYTFETTYGTVCRFLISKFFGC